MTEEEQEAYFERTPLHSITPNTLCNKHHLLKELEIIRQQGCAVDRQENTAGISCVAAPIFDFSGANVGAISVTGAAASCQAIIAAASKNDCVASIFGGESIVTGKILVTHNMV